MKIKSIIDNIIYYSLIIIGLSATSWLIWSRFIRERTIKNIPDALFTELRFWILIYICCIYSFSIKSLLKPKRKNEFMSFIIDQLFIPIKTLDHLIKYNKSIKSYYETFMIKIVNYLDAITLDTLKIIFYLLQICPRVILISFLTIDIFYFNRLELFYKIILIGLLPFMLRYILYSLKDVYDVWVKELEDKYSFVYIYEKGYEGRLSRKDNTKAIHHYERKSIKEYIEIKYENWLSDVGDEIDYEYVGTAFSKSEIITKYSLEKYNNADVDLKYEDYDTLRKLFEERMPLILNLRLWLDSLNDIKNSKDIKWCKIIIFSLYFICWFFTLTISYYHYPVTFDLFNYFVTNIMLYLCEMNDSFNITELQSFHNVPANVLKQSMKGLVEGLLKKLW